MHSSMHSQYAFTVRMSKAHYAQQQSQTAFTLRIKTADALTFAAVHSACLSAESKALLQVCCRSWKKGAKFVPVLPSRLLLNFMSMSVSQAMPWRMEEQGRGGGVG